MDTTREPGWREQMLREFEAAARERGPVNEEMVTDLMTSAIRLDAEEAGVTFPADPGEDGQPS